MQAVSRKPPFDEFARAAVDLRMVVLENPKGDR
jgi:hypothetical protein